MTQLRNWTAVVLLGWLLPLGIEASTSTAFSPLHTLDLRLAVSGAIAGQVMGNGLPVTAAQVRVLDKPHTTASATDGSFTLANVTAGVGYVVTVSAPGFASTSIANVTVAAGTRNLGVVTLRPLGGHKVITLAPDLNPVLSQVAEGGVAYRYYRVVSVDGKTPAGGVALQARLAGGAAIVQIGDVAENWPGREAGVSDADGIVRLRVPSSAIGSAGTTRTVEVLDAGQVVQTFDVRVIPFKHEKIWGHSLDGSVGGKLAGVRVEPGGKLKTEVKEAYTGAIALDQTIERTRTLSGKAGAEVSTGSFKLGSVKAGAKVGGGGYMDLSWSGKWRFAPDETGGILNMQKVYFAFGDIIFLGPLGADFYGKLSQGWYGVNLPDLLLVGSGGELHLGGYYEGEAGFHVGNLGPVNLRAGVELEGNLGGFLGYERSYSAGQVWEHTTLFGYESKFQAGGGATAALSQFNGNRLRGLGAGLHLGGRAALSGRVRTDMATGRIKSASLGLENEFSTGGGVEALGWKGVSAPLAGDESVTMSETFTLTFSGADSFARVAALGKLWNTVRPGSATTPLLNRAGVDETSTALAGAAEEVASWTTYERSIQRTRSAEFSFPIGVNTLAAALELNFTAQGERGAGMVIERGVAPGGRLFPQEYQPDQSLALIPTSTILDKELVWLARAEFPLTSGFSQFAKYFSTADPNLTVGGRFSMYFSDVIGGAQIVGSAIVRPFSTTAPQQRLAAQLVPQTGGGTEYLPAPGQTNYVYGVSGMLQLTTGTNAFPGTATLVMAYSNEQIAGLTEANLRIYRLAAGTNRWELVGGVVNAGSNLVTTVVSNFGTYAVAPPMPSGNVSLQMTNLNLVADGTNEVLLVATNLLLNTGVVASNAWLFTVDATGIELLEADASTNWPGVQVASSNGVLQVRLRTPAGGTHASVSVSSVAGDARGQVGIDWVDTVPPATPTNFMASAGQSRISVSWQTNREPDLAGYRVYYRADNAGPPWDGTAAVEGASSPVSVTGTNCLLRGLTVGVSYFVSVVAVDLAGNESPLATAVSVTTAAQPPGAPSGVAVRFGADGTNVLMWNLSEDDGYNDRDVVRYEIWRVVLPGASWLKVGEVEAGLGLFTTTNLTVGAAQYVRYAVTAVDQSGVSSGLVLANRFVPGTADVDNDGDGLADDWELANGLSASNPTDALLDPDGDGLSNLVEYRAGTNPNDAQSFFRLSSIAGPTGAGVSVTWGSVEGRLYTLLRTTSLTNGFAPLATNIVATPPQNFFLDVSTTNAGAYFYRLKLE